MKQTLHIKNLSVRTAEVAILHGVNLVIKPGEVHALMGPNGSGKSTLAYSLAGHPDYLVSDEAEVHLNGENILELSPDERAQRGLFLAFQYPVAIPGVSVQTFLRQAHQARFSQEPAKQFAKVINFRKYLEKLADAYGVPKTLLKRGLNEGFSGGEKKRLEVLQMAVLEPQYAILDETDSGLDIDAIKIVAAGVKKVVDTFGTGVLIITHYQRILSYVTPDCVHVLKKGKLIVSGGVELVEQLEKTGYTDL